MILEAILNLVFGLLIEFFDTMPNISWSVDDSAMTTFFGFISVILYLVPMSTVMQLLSIVFSILVFRIIIALIKTIWDLLPFA